MSATVIVDDHPLFREGLRAALESRGDFGTILEAGCVAEAAALLSGREGSVQGTPSPDLAVIDINLPDGSGLELLERFSGRRGAPRFMVLSMHADRETAIKAVRRGADGYASKQIPLDALILGLRLVRGGNLFLESELLRDILTVRPECVEAEAMARDAVSALTARERETLAILADGGSPKDVAAVLGVSLRTAENYQSALYCKLSLGSPSALVRLAIRAGLIVP